MVLGGAFIARHVDLGCGRLERPIPARAQAFGGRVTDPCSRLDDAHRSENRAVAGDIPELKELAERAAVEIARPGPKWLQTTELRRKCENSIVEKEIERLAADPIPNQQKALFDPVPDRERKHSNEALDRCDSPE